GDQVHAAEPERFDRIRDGEVKAPLREREVDQQDAEHGAERTGRQAAIERRDRDRQGEGDKTATRGGRCDQAAEPDGQDGEHGRDQQAQPERMPGGLPVQDALPALCPAGPGRRWGGGAHAWGPGDVAAGRYTVNWAAKGGSNMPGAGEFHAGDRGSMLRRAFSMSAAVSCGCSIGNRWLPSIICRRSPGFLPSTLSVMRMPTCFISCDCVPPMKATGQRSGWRRSRRSRLWGRVL